MQRVAQVLRGEWLGLVEREGTVGSVSMAPGAQAPLDPDAEPPCPACGTPGPPVDGECTGCGLFLG